MATTAGNMALSSYAELEAKKLYDQGGPQNGAEVAQLKAALAPVVGETDACILSAAAGGAVIESAQSWNDKRQSAEEACGAGGFLGFGSRSYEEASAELKKTNEQAAFYIDSMAKGKTALSTAQLDAQAKEDAKEIAAEAGKTVAKVAAVAAGGYALYLGAAALVAFIAVKAAK